MIIICQKNLLIFKTENTFLTAAHCLTALHARDITVVLGAHDLAKRFEPGRLSTPVESIHIHDKWNPSTNDYEGDIAILELTSKVTINRFVTPVCLANFEKVSILNGTVVGWGRNDDLREHSDIPRRFEVPILTDRHCTKWEPRLAKFFTDDVFCAGQRGAGVCEGDSGSGFYIQQDGTFYLRGIVSSAIRSSCNETTVAFYSDILKNLDFIRKVKTSTLFYDRHIHILCFTFLFDLFIHSFL